MGRFDGKNVVITGATSGIGLTTAELLVSEGARVLITGRSRPALASAAEQLGANATPIQSDAASLTDIAALAEYVRAEFGTLDALVVNAGVSRFAPFEATSESDFDELFTVNAKGAYFTVQALAPSLNPGSGVVLTTSVANVRGLPMISAYGASKAALRSMARGLARELLARNVRVNAVSPGAIDTDLLDRLMGAEAAEHAKTEFAENNPMRRLGKALEVAKAIVFLAFDATYTTGAELAIDGGGSQL